MEKEVAKEEEQDEETFQKKLHGPTMPGGMGPWG